MTFPRTYASILRIAFLIILVLALCGPSTAITAGLSPSSRLVRVAAGSLSVDSTPQGATVFVDGTRAGTTPLATYTTIPGTHALVVTLAGYQNYTATVTVSDGQNTAVSCRMSSIRGLTVVHAPVQTIGTPLVVRTITLNPTTTAPDSSKPWISGNTPSSLLTCEEPGNKIVYSGSDGNMAQGMPITFTIFDKPQSTVHDLPASGVVIGTTQVLPYPYDNNWSFTWHGGVPGYVLTPGAWYRVNVSLAPDNGLQFPFQYQCQPHDQWISGTAMSPNITCKKPTDVVTFLGSSGNISEGTPITFTILDPHGVTQKELPDNGVLLGTAIVRHDGFWRYNWSGAVTGYTLTYGNMYEIRAEHTETDYLRLGVNYYCQPGDVPQALPDASVMAVNPQAVVLSTQVQLSGAVSGSSGQGSSGDSAKGGGEVAMSPLVPVQPDSPTPLKSIFDFFGSLFGGGKPVPK